MQQMQSYIHVYVSSSGAGGGWRRLAVVLWLLRAARPPVSPGSSPPQYSAPTQISHAFPVQPSQHSQFPQLHKPFPVRRCEKKSCELRDVPSCLTFNKVPLFTPCFPGSSSGRGLGTEADFTARDSLGFSTSPT